MALRQKCAHELFRLAIEGIHAKKDIDGNDECNKTVYRSAKDYKNTVYHIGSYLPTEDELGKMFFHDRKRRLQKNYK